jgi:hypothetical protein
MPQALVNPHIFRRCKPPGGHHSSAFQHIFRSDFAVPDRKKLENTLKIEIDAEAFDRLYGFVSHPIPFRAGRRVAVRVVSQFGEESTKVLKP